ncbi:hypothetical protein HK405_001982 [Cladochytrium tenue]|nr:hypothetical protein HK405_001982 [Cladochytrium tenue]
MQSRPTSPDDVNAGTTTVRDCHCYLIYPGVKCNGDGDTPLHVALKFKGAGAVAKLLSLVARVDIANKAQQHPIHLEAAHMKLNAIHLLIDAGPPSTPRLMLEIC